MDSSSMDMYTIISKTLTQYGDLGMAMVTILYFLNQIKTKLNLLLEMNNRVFGLLISLVDKQQRDAETIRLANETKLGRGEK